MAAVGDLMFARDVVTLMEQHGTDYPFERVARSWAGSDLFLGNFEGTFTEQSRARPKFYTFRAPPALATTLGEAGFDIVSLANNHALDFGTPGLLDTLATLDRLGVASFGAGLDLGRAPARPGARGLRYSASAPSGARSSRPRRAPVPPAQMSTWSRAPSLASQAMSTS